MEEARQKGIQDIRSRFDTYKKLSAMSPEEFVEDYHGYKRDKHGNWGYYESPNAKWDWYQVGGRWAGSFLLKPDGEGRRGERSLLDNGPEIPENRVDQACKRDIDWDQMAEHRVQNAKKNWIKAHEEIAAAEKEEIDPSIIKGDDIAKIIRARKVANVKSPMFGYDIRDDDTMESYVARAAASAGAPFAILHDGKWIEKGQMGWWGMASNEKDETEWGPQFQAFLEQLPEDTMLTMVDCHI